MPLHRNIQNKSCSHSRNLNNHSQQQGLVKGLNDTNGKIQQPHNTFENRKSKISHNLRAKIMKKTEYKWGEDKRKSEFNIKTIINKVLGPYKRTKVNNIEQVVNLYGR